MSSGSGSSSGSLEACLRDALSIMDNSFRELDQDHAGEVTIQELARKLAMRGFKDTQKLQEVFGKVDRNRSGTVAFPEYLMLMYLWNDIGPKAYEQMFGNARAAESVNRGFARMEHCYIQYDLDKTRQLKHDEFHRFMTEQLPKVFAQPAAQNTMSRYFPAEVPYLRFHNFLYLLYKLLIPATRRASDGGQATRPTTAGGSPAPAAAGAAAGPSSLITQLRQAFSALERDFFRFDTENTSCINLSQLTEGLSTTKPSSELIDVLGRLEHYFQMVDLDASGTLSFKEFMYLMYLMCQHGAYKDIMADANDAAIIKKVLKLIEQNYIKYDLTKTRRLERSELHAFLRENLGEDKMPEADEIFTRLQTSPQKPTIDLSRFIQLLYELVCPSGRYTKTAAAPPPAPKDNLIKTWRQAPAAAAPRGSGRVRVDPLDPSEVIKDKQIGQGGFGAVFSARFRGEIIAAKYLLETASPELCAETEKEVNVMKMFDHPNIVFLIGACTTMPDVCIVTEFCSHGSLFTCMHQKRLNFDHPSLWRIMRECATGLHVLHCAEPTPVIHRDIKSLNVLLDENWVVKICDFGLSKIMTHQSMMMTKGLGTPHWMAPEVIGSSHYGKPSDVYSYGILVWELWHRQIPYGNMDATQICMGVVQSKPPLRPPIAKTVPDLMARFMVWCWNQEPSQRPTFANIIAQLDKMKPHFAPQV